LDQLQASMMLMPIKEKMAIMQDQKQLRAKKEELSKAQNHRATMIEPLQEIALQASMEVSVSHAEVKQILETSTEKYVEIISSHTLEEVLEQAQRARLLTVQVKEKVVHLVVPQQNEG